MELDSLFRVFRLQGLPPMAQFVLTSLSAMFGLALLDFIGAVLAKEWADTRQPWWFVAGLLTFMGLFAFYATSLKTAELSVVTIGWVVFLQVGLLLYERLRYGTDFPPLKWAAIVLILVLQAYLILVPNEAGAAGQIAGEPIGAEQQ
jgi:multidrug transporter EmrE-like cation transporter